MPDGRRRVTGRVLYWVLCGAAVLCLVTSGSVEVTSFRLYNDPSSSMENTIMPGDRMLVVPGPDVHRGDVVVLTIPGHTGLSFVRRVIGLPGDRVACCMSAWLVTVNGRPLAENYLRPGDAPSSVTFSDTLGAGQIWVMGDHRSGALDSRSWGPVPASGVIGRVAVVIRGTQWISLHTPRTFTADGLAPSDTRGITIWPLLIAAASLVALVILLVFGIARLICRRRSVRRLARTRTAQET
jgi:signal peptidase I